MLANAYNGKVKQATRNVQIVLQHLLHNELNSDVQSALPKTNTFGDGSNCPPWTGVRPAYRGHQQNLKLNPFAMYIRLFNLSAKQLKLEHCNRRVESFSY